MKRSVWYRSACVILVLFALGHTLLFRQSDPSWGVDALIASMRATTFAADGFHRTYWDLFTAAGFCAGVFYLFSAVLAWQLGTIPAAAFRHMRGVAWAFAASFAVITIISCLYLFVIPIVFPSLVTICLVGGVLSSYTRDPAADSSSATLPEDALSNVS